ncbi:DUF1963 domain-containing protein [Kribbella sp. NPDC048915]|uniref:YwqG family protein n=1 Tax=Kribbella sp. NPDC048915 TaxID=3155148 RepID=UPI0033C333F1
MVNGVGPGGGYDEVAARRVAREEARAREVAPSIHMRDESDERRSVVTAVARKYLPADVADEFVAMLRPALRLVRARDGEPVVAQLGGLPTVSALSASSWPTWEGHGPLDHVLSFDCAPVAAMLPELGLPTDGRLAFFYFDGKDEFESTVGPWDPSTRPGFRVLHLAASTRADAATPAPRGLDPFPAVPLAAVRTLSWPSYQTLSVEALWSKHGLRGPSADPVIDGLYDELWKLPDAGYDTHQIGGHAWSQQAPVELEVEQLRCGLAGEPFDWSDPSVQSATSEWQLLLQVASDDAANMMWGDLGQLYYLVRDAQQPADALFTWQCG